MFQDVSCAAPATARSKRRPVAPVDRGHGVRRRQPSDAVLPFPDQSEAQMCCAGMKAMYVPEYR